MTEPSSAVPTFTLIFGTDDVPDDAEQIGWIGSNGPAIAEEHWPRGPLTGLPMLHAFTLTLPEPYRRRGPQYPGIAFFQGEGEFAEKDPEGPDPESADPFLCQWAAAIDHPMLERRTDIIDGQFALLWLSAEEIAGGPTPPPADTRRAGEHPPEDEGPNAWDNQVDHAPVFAYRREDPNAGLAPTEDEDGEYQQPLDGETYSLKDWAQPLAGLPHLGGTAFPVQALPENLSPYYLEFPEFGELNFGGGSAQLDLETDAFDWACG